MKKSFIIAAMVLLVVSLSLPAKASEDVLTVDRQYVISQSKAGKSLAKQSESLNKVLIDQRDSFIENIETENKKLEEDKTLLAPELFQERLQKLQGEAEAKQLELQTRGQKVQEALQRSLVTIQSVMNPILQELVNEEGAMILLDKQTIIFGDPKLDISAEVVKRLNKRLPDVEVTISDE